MRMGVHREHEPGHQPRRPADTIVRRLISPQIVSCNRLNQLRRLLKSQTNTLACQRIAGAGGVANQSQSVTINASQTARSGASPAELAQARQIAQSGSQCRYLL